MKTFIKQTEGYVDQVFHERNDGVFVCVSQTFTASDIVEYEDGNGKKITEPKHRYEPYTMVVR